MGLFRQLDWPLLTLPLIIPFALSACCYWMGARAASKERKAKRPKAELSGCLNLLGFALALGVLTSVVAWRFSA